MSATTKTCLAWLFGMAAAAASAYAEPLATRQTAFTIPFRIDPPRSSTQQPVEVQLYVSTDRGGAWKLHSRVPPDRQRFQFRAPADGEYWFFVRTKDNTGRLLPDKPYAPELQVVVDTTQPALELKATRGNAGDLTIYWRAADPHLEPQNLKLDYQTEGAADLWQSIAIDPQRTRVTADGCWGVATVWTRPTSEPIIIRGEITDVAGNLAVAQTKVELPGTEPAPKEPADPIAQGDYPGNYPDTGAKPLVPAVNASTGISGWVSQLGRETTSRASSTPPPVSTPAPPAASPAPSNSPDTAAAPAAGAFFSALGMRWPADEHTAAPLEHSVSQPPAVAPPAVQHVVAGTRGALVTVSPRGASTADSNSQAASTSNDWIQPPLRDVQPPSKRSINDPAAAIRSVSSAAAAGYMPPPGHSLRMVNSRTFQLEYDLSASAPGGVRKVELWGTRDGGQRWMSYGSDPDNQSPMTVTVEGEGIYGFRILVQSATGRIEFPPQRGDRPESWLAVDLTPPTCRLTHVQPAMADHTPQLQIAWEAHDEWLAERPISLSYSAQPSGPWLAIATGLENTGRYTWTLDNRVPQQVYLRLEARDQAGNVEVFQSPEPVHISTPVPQSRIRDVRPTYETGRGPKLYRFW